MTEKDNYRTEKESAPTIGRYNNNTSKRSPLLYLLFLSLIIGPIIGVIISDGWVDTDTYAFYNQRCNNATTINTPVLSNQIFDFLPCNPIAWKIFQGIIIISILFALRYSSKIIGFEKHSYYLFFLMGFLTIFLMSIEDDHLGFPIIIIGSYLFIKSKNILRFIPYSLLIILLYYFFWQGAPVVMLPILFWGITPVMSTIPVVLYYAYFGISDWGLSSEAMIGNGFLTNNLLLVILIGLLLFSYRSRVYFDKTRKYWPLLASMLFLGFIQPKWELYSIIPLFIITWYFVKPHLFTYKRIQLFKLFCVSIFFMTSIFTLLIINPTPSQWELLYEARDLQQEGHVLINDWGLGQWLFYIGGIPSHDSGYKGFELITEKEYIWLGSEKDYCHTINYVDNLYLQYCKQ